MKNNYLKLGKIIRNEREEKGFSRRKLSALVDISDTELKRIENGERQVPNIITLIKLCKILKLENKEWYNENLLSLAGVYQPAKKIDESKIPLALNYYLNQNQNIKKIILHLDNDSAGRIATMALKTIIPKQYEVVDDPPKVGKDFNDFLCDRVGINYKKRYGKER